LTNRADLFLTKDSRGASLVIFQSAHLPLDGQYEVGGVAADLIFTRLPMIDGPDCDCPNMARTLISRLDLGGQSNSGSLVKIRS